MPRFLVALGRDRLFGRLPPFQPVWTGFHLIQPCGFNPRRVGLPSHTGPAERLCTRRSAGSTNLSGIRLWPG